MIDPVRLKFKRLRPGAKLPTKAYDSDAAWDLYVPEQTYVYASLADKKSLGISWECPPGWYAQIVGRSGLAAEHGLLILGGAVDAGYRDEWRVICEANESFALKAGDRIAQFVLLPVPNVVIEEVDALAESDRGAKGFGSTGR